MTNLLLFSFAGTGTGTFIAGFSVFAASHVFAFGWVAGSCSLAACHVLAFCGIAGCTFGAGGSIAGSAALALAHLCFSPFFNFFIRVLSIGVDINEQNHYCGQKQDATEFDQ
jgi:hypothetical protein